VIYVLLPSLPRDLFTATKKEGEWEEIFDAINPAVTQQEISSP